MSTRKWMMGAVLALVASSPLIADENHVVGRIQGYADVVEAITDQEDPNLVLLQTLMHDLDTTGDAMAKSIGEMSDRAFQSYVETLEDSELKIRLTSMETPAARAEVIKAIRLDFLGKKMALFDRLSEMSPADAQRAIRDLLVEVESPDNGQAFTKEFGTAVGKFFGKVGGFIAGHSLFAAWNTVKVVGAGPFLVVVKILSTAGKGVYIGFQYTKEFRHGLRTGTKTGWKTVRAKLEGEEQQLTN